MATSRPLYIALEGLDGCGKTTIAYLLADRLGAVLTKENGGTDVGREIRKITHGPLDMESETEMLLFMADRVQHLAQVVEPALEAGDHVISDRSMISSLAYQGGGRELGWGHVLDAHDQLRIRRPDVVLYLKAGIGIRSRRMQGRQGAGDRIESEFHAFHSRVEDAYKEMMESDIFPIWPINAELNAQHVLAEIARVLSAKYDLEVPRATF